MRAVVLAVLFAVSSPAVSTAQTLAGAEPIIDVAPVIVTGVQPGPGMWKVSKGEHVMWILGTQSPLPTGMEWVSRDVEAVLAQAQEVISAPNFIADADIGFFGKLALLPAFIGFRKNPGGRTLQEIVPAEMHARWLGLKHKYIGRDRGIEKWRPIFAAMELYGEAIEDSGLGFGSVVDPVVTKVAKERGITHTQPVVRVSIDEPKAALREFRTSTLDDIACFDKTLRRLETDIGAMTERANAWAVGDLDRLRALPVIDNSQTCVNAALQTGLAKKLGMDDAEARTERAWIEAAQNALARNRVTFATLPMQDVLRGDGYLARLAAAGYAVEAP
jgi:hypothetical protein